MHSKNNKCSSLPSSYLLFLFSSHSHFSCLFSQYPLILSFLILCSLFYRLSTSSSLFFNILSCIIPTCIVSVCLSLFYFVLLFSFFSSFIFPAFSFLLFPTILPWWKNVFHHILFSLLFSLFSMLLWRLFMFSSFFFPLFFLFSPNHI